MISLLDGLDMLRKELVYLGGTVASNQGDLANQLIRVDDCMSAMDDGHLLSRRAMSSSGFMLGPTLIPLSRQQSPHAVSLT